MPPMNGRELATRLESIRPGTKVLFMSSNMNDEFHGMAQPERDFIQKPFTPADLAEKLRRLLATKGKHRKARHDQVLLVHPPPHSVPFLTTR
jgi:DNA-binding response OmpR family regulator